MSDTPQPFPNSQSEPPSTEAAPTNLPVATVQKRGFWSHFERFTTSGRVIREIDGLRFVAISAVVVYHFWQIPRAHAPVSYHLDAWEKMLWTIIRRGFLGVELFFVISGFILGMPFAAHFLKQAAPVNLRRYLWRRVTRLEVPYLLTLLLYFLAFWVSGQHDLAELWPRLWASIFYLHGFVYQEASLINRSAWSLEIEVQFYLLAPFLALVFALPTGFRRAVLGITMMAGAVLAAQVEQPWRFPLPYYLQYFAAGFLLTDFYLSGQLRPERTERGLVWTPNALLFDGACLAGLALIVGLQTASRLEGHLLLPWIFVVLAVGAFRGWAFNRLLTWLPLTITGGMCYTIYLLHAQIISFWVQGPLRAHFSGDLGRDVALLALVAMPVLVGVSLGFFYFVERPCMVPDWPAKLRARLQDKKTRTPVKISE